jgi:hypothetical protein
MRGSIAQDNTVDEEGFEVRNILEGSGDAEATLVEAAAHVKEELLYLVAVEESPSQQDALDALPAIIVPEKYAHLPIYKPHAYPCSGTFQRLPPDPATWPQAPLLLRPTPGSNTVIRGVRHANSTVYDSFPGYCDGCMLPVNTGQEKPGKTRVIDFETPLFVGTLLVRIKGTKPTNDDYDEDSYFKGRKRTFQVIVKGKFKPRAANLQPFASTDLVTGQVFERPAGKLPAQFLVSSFLKLVSYIAPQLDAHFGSQPRFVTPLFATAQVIQVKNHAKESKQEEEDERFANYQLYQGATDMEEELEEPPADSPMSVLQGLDAGSTETLPIDQRHAFRKKIFNQLAASNTTTHQVDLTKEHTFEFYQHLLNFTHAEQFQLQWSYGQCGIAQALNGQPLKIMAAVKGEKLTPLWSFDIWHQSLYPRAQLVFGG